MTFDGGAEDFLPGLLRQVRGGLEDVFSNDDPANWCVDGDPAVFPWSCTVGETPITAVLEHFNLSVTRLERNESSRGYAGGVGGGGDRRHPCDGRNTAVLPHPPAL